MTHCSPIWHRTGADTGSGAPVKGRGRKTWPEIIRTIRLFLYMLSTFVLVTGIWAGADRVATSYATLTKAVVRQTHCAEQWAEVLMPLAKRSRSTQTVRKD